MQETERNILKKISLDNDGIARLESTTSKLKRIIEEAITSVRLEHNVEYDIDVLLVGSVVKGTYDRNPDIDYFLRFPLHATPDDLRSVGLAIGRKVLPDGVEKYAQHPYISGSFGGFDVDIVPAYWIENANQRVSAVDRTPLHTQYVLEHLPVAKRDDVRLLKAFFKGIGVYGAESSVQGFSGYMTELLVIKFGGFRKVLEGAKGLRPGRPVLLDGVSTKKKFNEPLVFIDPVDPNRNAASAVSLRSLGIFVTAARDYLRSPSESFFFPKQRKPMTVDEVREMLGRLGSNVLTVQFDPPADVLEDNLSDQCRKTVEALEAQFRHRKFNPMRSGFVVGDKCILLLEYSPPSPLGVYYHTGPPFWDQRLFQFLDKYKDRPSGQRPYLDGYKWVVYRQVDADVEETARAALVSGSVGKNLKPIFKQGKYELHTDLEDMGADELALITEVLDWKPPWRI